jgi:hypothetical protein
MLSFLGKQMKSGVLCLSLLVGFWLFAPTTKAIAAGPVSSAPTLDPDGDDPRLELLYHWQDKRFSDEERHQILVCSLFISVLFIGGAVERKTRKGRLAK